MLYDGVPLVEKPTGLVISPDPGSTEDAWPEQDPYATFHACSKGQAIDMSRLSVKHVLHQRANEDKNAGSGGTASQDACHASCES